MNYDIYHLRNTQMDDKLQAQLSSIIYAYRPHDEIPTKEELESDNEPITSSRGTHTYVSLKSICQQQNIEYNPKKHL